MKRASLSLLALLLLLPAAAPAGDVNARKTEILRARRAAACVQTIPPCHRYSGVRTVQPCVSPDLVYWHLRNHRQHHLAHYRGRWWGW